MKDYHEWEYNFPEMWFTGEEWANGTAEEVYAEMYAAGKARLDEKYKAERENNPQDPSVFGQDVE